MSSDALETLAISHLRGSTSKFVLTFAPPKKLTIVYGENASGKSTVCDSLELLGSGKVGSLDGRGLGQTYKYWPSVGKVAADVEVVLKGKASEHRVTVNTKGDVTIDPASDPPRIDVLRRSQIVSLILATEADRYKEIARFIDVAAVQDGEAALGAALRTAEGEQKTAITRISENRDAIESFWSQVGSPGSDGLTWARAQFPRMVESTLPISALARLCGAFDRFSDFPQQLEDASNRVTTAQGELAASSSARAQEAFRSSQASGPTLQLLEAAEHFFQGHPNVDVCPLCESPDRAAGLAQRVREKLTEFATLQSFLEAERGREENLRRAQQTFASIEGGLQQVFTQFSSAAIHPDLPSGTAVPDDPMGDNVEALRAWLDKHGSLRGDWDRTRRALDDDERFYGTLEIALSTFDTNVLREAELSTLLPALKASLEIVSSERHAYVDNKLAAIATQVGQLYDKVHPGEGLDKISLALNPKRSASLVMGASFEGNDVPPQAYFSDSHLDTLGLCIFLALAKLDEPAGKILVLDDVLGSVDEPHVDRLIEMICEEAEDFRHCVVTTHYRPWREKFRWGWLKTGQCHFVELARWTSSSGVTMTRTPPEVERLRHLLADAVLDPQAICSKSGVILEGALDFLTQLYECAVPRKRNDEYTLGDLLPTIRGKLRESLRVEVLEAGGTHTVVHLKPILDEIERIAQTRNAFGAHFKEISFELLDSDAFAFGLKVLELMDTLTDQEVGWPRSDRSGSYWSTSGETRRLHPLKKPS